MARTVGSTAEQTRGRILHAAKELFIERGYASTSIRDIADHLGMTKAALYYHFPAKQDLLDALITPLLERVDGLAAAAAAQHPVDREAAVRTFVRLFAEPDVPMGLLVSDPSAVREAAARLDVPGRIRRLLHALAGGDEPDAVLAVHCALGAVRAGIMATRYLRPGVPFDQYPPAPGCEYPAAHPHTEPLTDAQVDLIVRAALRAWSVVDQPAADRVG